MMRRSPTRIVEPEMLLRALRVLSGMRNRLANFPNVSPTRTLYQREESFREESFDANLAFLFCRGNL